MPEATLILTSYVAFFMVAVLAFALAEARVAAVLLYFGGWLLLPVAIYPANTLTASYFTVDVIGAGLPSNLGLTKAVVVPLATLVAWLALRVRRFALTDLVLLDAAMAGFCLWPVAGALIRGNGMAGGGHDALYLLASWGASWALARGLFNRPADGVVLLRAAAWSGVALLPVALLEGIAGPWLYRAVWGDHPFLLDGERRTFGHRPLGLLENGNQYALWMALAAFAWMSLIRLGRLSPKERVFAIATVAATAAAQSVGAIALLLAASLAAVTPVRRLRQAVLIGGAALALLGLVYVSGVVPAERIAQRIGITHQLADRFDAIHLRSLLYRVRRDQMAVPLLSQSPFAGAGRWDWWRPLGSHPWGLPLLIAGQFGAVSLLLLLTALLTPAIAALFRDDRTGLLCALVVLVAAADALFNSFVYFPAVLFAGALAGAFGKRNNGEMGEPER